MFFTVGFDRPLTMDGVRIFSGLKAMGERINADFPPFSRVFVVCSKEHKDEEIRKAFEQYGTVEDVWMVKDRMTKENKGICYVKFDKASSAALAIESLDGKTIGEEKKPIKVRTYVLDDARTFGHLRRFATIHVIAFICLSLMQLQLKCYRRVY